MHLEAVGLLSADSLSPLVAVRRRTERSPERISIRTAAAVLRAERFAIRQQAQRIDRALRTATARRIAHEVFDWATSTRLDEPMHLLRSLSARPTWFRASEDEYFCAFGRRRSSVVARSMRDLEEIAAMIVRTETRITLGDVSMRVALDLQAYAERELRRLFASR